MEFSVFRFVHISCCLLTGYFWEKSIHPPMRCLCTLTRCPLSFLQAEQPQLFQKPVIWQMQQLIIFMVFHSSIAMSLFLVLESPELDVAFQVWPYQCCVEGKDHLFWPSGNSLLPWPRMVLGLTAARAHCCSAWPPGSPGPFLQSNTAEGALCLITEVFN